MASKPHFLIGLLVCLFTGCATQTTSLTLDPVGPDSGGNVFASRGQLMVFSATEQVNDGGIPYYPHTGYTLYSPEGKRIKYVKNRVGNDDKIPMTVALPPGSYTVKAISEVYGVVRVPVVIEGARLTRVYLERGGIPKREREGMTNLVFFPNGDAIGSKARSPKLP